jgi:uncharacterized membrane protein YhaH (DUF805 family)
LKVFVPNFLLSLVKLKKKTMSAFQEYFVDVMKYKYADFSGRARRSEYWFFSLFSGLIIMGLMFMLFPIIGLGGGELSGLAYIPLALIGIFYLAILIPGLAVMVRRFHDSGKSGWFFLLAFIPLGSLVLFVFTLLDSEPNTNKWGPNPKLPSLDNDVSDHLLEDDIV